MAREPAITASLRGQRHAVLGLARTGLSAARFLRRSGAEVIAWDQAGKAREAAAAAIPGLRIADFAGDATGDGRGLAGLDGIVCSPGVPLNRHPLAALAARAGVPILGDMELFQWARPTLPAHKVVAITGTNGKSTTTALIHHLLAHAGRAADLGGNIGLPVLDQPPLPAGGIYVFELSSFQIDLCHSFAADIAIFTNLTPDHLDRYDGMEGYFQAKMRLFRLQPPGGHAVVAADDSYAERLPGLLPPGTVAHIVHASAIDRARQARWPALSGPHNAQNVACAVAAARILGLDDAEIEAGLQGFAGLPHRMQILQTIGGVRYIDDSKATNPTSVAPALAAFPSIHWILGGRRKTDELDACLPHLAHVKAAYPIGEAEECYRAILSGRVPVVPSGDLATAVARAAAAARPGDVVLLSPACASYDQFPNYEVRGDVFRALVAGLNA